MEFDFGPDGPPPPPPRLQRSFNTDQAEARRQAANQIQNVARGKAARKLTQRLRDKNNVNILHNRIGKDIKYKIKDMLGGKRKTNKRKTNKRKTNKRKTNKRKINKRKTNKRKTNRKILRKKN